MTARASERWLGAVSAAITLTCAARASAHAPPMATGVQWQGERALVRTNRGLIVQDAGRQSFRLLCNDAFQASLVEVAPVARLSDGQLLIGTFDAGLLRASPDLCSFDSVGSAFSGVNTTAVSVDSRGLIRAVVLPEDGSPATLLESRDDGRSFVTLTTLSDTPTALEVAPSDGDRLYISMFGARGNATFARLLRSMDGARTFADFPIELDDSELRALVSLVDPRTPDRLFVRTQSRDGETPERLLRSDDGGQKFDTVLQTPGPLTVTVASNGTVWVGSAAFLYRSDDQGRTFTPQSSLAVSHVTCLASKGERLYVCGFYDGEFGVLSTSDQGESLAWFLRFPEVRARLDCAPGSDEAERCDLAFTDWSLEQGSVAPSTGGGGGNASGSPSAAGRPGEDGGRSGCELSSAPHSEKTTTLWLLLGFAFLVRGRRQSGRLLEKTVLTQIQ